ncbi:glycoside hydrolase family 43 protein [Pseudochryseolinea flava]|uniref:glycoside hydrolase family 43 protein n=1 Tax=Pseudochryseolinea flava TaxID=2059302 RepID=UPI001FE7745B|nr:glycoside hydrolase family 43 protein [Pseudochryseolinea flava]
MSKNVILRKPLLMIMLLIVSMACKDDHGTVTPPPVTVSEFKNPLLLNGPDPWVFKKDKIYYATHTTGNGLKLYATSNMANLSSATSKNVWLAPSTGMNAKNIWAPEIHFINNAWYCYYAADDGDNANHRMWVLENKSANPMNGTWEDKGKLELGDDKWAIDGTVFYQGDQLYMIWSGWEDEPFKSQELYISKMSNPWTAEGPRVQISKPELSWEQIGGTINEGPQILRRGDKIFIVYSASGCWTDDYTLGLLTAEDDADLMDPDSWVKDSQPVFSKLPEGQVYGPGHCSFFTSDDGTDWIVYHANPQTGQGCGNNRSIRMQPFSWDNNGKPFFGKPVPLGVGVKKPS